MVIFQINLFRVLTILEEIGQQSLHALNLLSDFDFIAFVKAWVEQQHNTSSIFNQIVPHLYLDE